MRLRPILLLAMLAAAACDSATAPATSSIALEVAGLPAGVPSAVIVTGPDGFRVTVDSSRTLSSLTAGSYVVTASAVTSSVGRYAPSPATQTVVVDGIASASASAITYSIATARLVATVVGLPAGTGAGVTVTGPAGFSRTITATTQIDLLEPGAYTITAADVQSGSRTYRPAARTQQVQLVASMTPTASTVSYSSGTGVLAVSIAGLPGALNASVSVSGPGGFARTITTSTTLDQLEPGVYTTTSGIVGSALTTYRPTPATQASTIADGSMSTVTVNYAGAPLDLGVQFVADGLTQPVYVTAPDGDARLFVVERIGRIRTIQNGALSTAPFLDIRSRVNNTGERGMLSMAFDPRYASNGYFYVYYVNVAGDMTIERFASTPGSDISGPSAGLVTTIPHGGNEHHGGLITFGPDDMLYIAPGDGGCCGDPQNNAQNLRSLLGKVLRIDVRTLPYTVPASNPFVGRTDAAPEIWAYGLRNPWRYSFDVAGGMLYIGDVGDNTREEVNAVPLTTAGVNYGWRFMEGAACFNPSTGCATGRTLTLPVYDYPHSDGCSVTGGQVYRGSAIPELAGHYLFADFCRGWVRSFRMSGGSAIDLRAWSGISVPFVVSFGRDGLGEMYVVAGTRVLRIVRKP